MRIVDDAIVFNCMVQQGVKDFEEDGVLGTDAGNRSEFRDKESC